MNLGDRRARPRRGAEVGGARRRPCCRSRSARSRMSRPLTPMTPQEIAAVFRAGCGRAVAVLVRVPGGIDAADLPDGRYSARPAEAQLSRQMPKAREGDPRSHRADACESI